MCVYERIYFLAGLLLVPLDNARLPQLPFRHHVHAVVECVQSGHQVRFSIFLFYFYFGIFKISSSILLSFFRFLLHVSFLLPGLCLLLFCRPVKFYLIEGPRKL